ncbi:TPA: hypothetical protein LTU30_002761, partial [Enterococcus faecium]|nr:hypothetical protein [Enterococcus faecium]HBL8367553.1 hypothetical protein [Enterococcus faecium]
MKQNLKYLIVIVLTVLVVTYSYSLGPLIKKIDQPDQADAILQVITTIVGGILSGLVAYGIAFIEIKNYKKEQLIEKQEITISEAKKNIDRMKRLLVEIEDNKDACQQLNLLEDELESNILVIKLSVSDFFWKLSSNDII